MHIIGSLPGSWSGTGQEWHLIHTFMAKGQRYSVQCLLLSFPQPYPQDRERHQSIREMLTAQVAPVISISRGLSTRTQPGTLTPRVTPRPLKPQWLENRNSWLLPPPRHGLRHLGAHPISVSDWVTGKVQFLPEPHLSLAEG